MANNMSFNTLAEQLNSGRTCSPASVKDLVLKTLNSPIRDIYPDSMEDSNAYDCMWILLESLKTDDICRSYGDTLLQYWNEYRVSPCGSEMIAALAFPGGDTKIRRSIHPFFRLPLKEYCAEAGRLDLYDRWFSGDAKAWERDHNGMHPEVCDVLEKCFKACAEAGEYAFPYEPDSMMCLYDADHIFEPFRRRNMKKTDCNEMSLAATRVMILLMALPEEYRKNEKSKGEE